MVIFYIRSGKNQNDASKYTIIQLYENEQTREQADEQAEDMADEQANEQARELANEYIKNKTKCLYIYINNNTPENEFEDLTKEDWRNIRSILKNIDLLVCKGTEDMIRITGRQEEFEAYYWGVKELYKSPHRTYLNTVKREKIALLYANAKKKLDAQKKEYMTLDLLNYFIKSLKLEAEKEFNNAR